MSVVPGCVLPRPFRILKVPRSIPKVGCLDRVFCFLRSSSKKINIKVYRTLILPFVLYGCETWLLTLREERRLKVFEKRVFRKIFGPKRDEVSVSVAARSKA